MLQHVVECLLMLRPLAIVDVDSAHSIVLNKQSRCLFSSLSLVCARASLGVVLMAAGRVFPFAAFFDSADEMDAYVTTAKGGDAAGELRRLEDALKRLRAAFKDANGLAVGAEEAAAKCQVHALLAQLVYGREKKS